MQLIDLFERLADRGIALDQWRDDPTIYVSFTQLAKIGINPRSNWSTPLGVYAYPLREMFASIKDNDIPFAGGSPFIQVLKSENVVELAEYSEADLGRDIATLRTKYIEPLLDGGLWENRPPLSADFDELRQAAGAVTDRLEREGAGNSTIYDTIFDFVLDTWAAEAVPATYPGSKFWNITREMANLMTQRRAKGNASSVAWNGILRALGYNAFADKTGLGIIHPNEPISAVFLTGVAFTHVASLPNVVKRAAP